MGSVSSLRLRLSIGALLPLVVALAAQAGYALVSQRSAADDGLENKARALAGLMVNVVGPSLAFDDDKAVTDDLGYVAADSDFDFAAAVRPDNKLVGLRGAAELRAETMSTLVATPRPIVYQIRDLLIAAVPVITDGKQIGTVIVGLRNDAIQAQVSQTSAWAAGISILGILIAIVVVSVLAGKISRRNEQMRIVLDNVDEALATINPDGTLDPECSAAFVRWFGPPGADSFAAQISRGDDRLRMSLEEGWSELVAGVMPMALLVEQFPSAMVQEGKHFRIDIKPLVTRDVVMGALLRIRDVTTEVEAQRTLAIQREYVAVFERALADPRGIRELIEDTGSLVRAVEAGIVDVIERKRAVHTIKGNAAVYGVDSVARVAHQLEDHMECHDELDARVVAELVTVWNAFATRVEQLISGSGDVVDVPRNQLEAIADLADGGLVVADQLRGLLLEPVAIRYDGFRRQIERLATKLGKPTPTVVIADNGLRMSPGLRPFWAAFSHLVRNSLDHGIELADERVAAGKPAVGTISLRAWRVGDDSFFEIADDGRGIGWDAVRAKAIAAGLPAATSDDLQRALLSDGISTADSVSETSGRGIGLAAVQSAVLSAGGRLQISSEPGRGTRFTFTFPVVTTARTRRAQVHIATAQELR
jgi:signal transduction histidine kinase